jgi:hypothetical protein
MKDEIGQEIGFIRRFACEDGHNSMKSLSLKYAVGNKQHEPYGSACFNG